MEFWAIVLNKEENIIGNTTAQCYNYATAIGRKSGPQTPCGLQRRSEAARLLRL